MAVVVAVALSAAGVSGEPIRHDDGVDPIPKEVERLYRQGLNYLSMAQTTVGNWRDSYGQQPGAVGLIALAIMAHGDDPNVGPYSHILRNALEFILASMNPTTGYIGSSMYNHGFATLALAEAYGAVEDERLGPALKKAIDLIVLAQKDNPTGGWRYSPQNKDADITVSGAQLVALLAARNAGLDVPEQAIRKGLDFIHKCRASDGSYGYTPGSGGANSPRASIAVLTMALAQDRDTPAFMSAARFIQKPALWKDNSYFYYFLYYLSQALFHSHMDVWVEWNEQNIQTLAAGQNMDGSWSGRHGQSFSTATALLSLALNYRYLPIYER